jgi:hypothetical protein
VLSRRTAEVKVWEVPFSSAAINTFLNHVARPVIRSIELEAFTPNTQGWHCSERFCSYWPICPLGQAAHPQPPAKEVTAA